MAFGLVISMLASFGFLLNDLCDRNIDRVNRAGHFEDSTTTTLAVAVVTSLSFLSAALLISYQLGRAEFLLATGIAMALIAYSVLLRKLLLMPTIVAAILATSPLWSPLILWDAGDKSEWVFVWSLILMVAAREIFMDVRDRSGDLSGNRDTLATVFGGRIAKFVATLLTVSAGIPFIFSIAHNTRGHSIIVTSFAFLLAGAIFCLLVQPALKTLTDATDERRSIQRYVLSSRVAMALIPLLVLFWTR